MKEDTIAALATPQGVGGIAVIRVSGPEAEKIANTVFRAHRNLTKLRSHTLHMGFVVDQETNEIIDEVLAVLMRKPHSYTGEDVFEIHSHGGWVIPQRVLEAVLKAGARLAQPGEFTRRAFLNGRMDLSQAEAVCDLITAETKMAANLALTQLRGEVGKKIKTFVEELSNLLAHTEAVLDFSEDEEIPPLPKEEFVEKLQDIVGKLNRISASYKQGRMYRQGVSVVIVGRTNVGKSSLLNNLLGEKRAIVTPIPGTTRDFIAETIEIGGLPVKLTDTAGIRNTDDIVEKEGIELVWEKVSTADVVILLFDGSTPVTDEDIRIIQRLGSKSYIPAINKVDLPIVISEDTIRNLTGGKTPLYISAKYGTGIEDLKKTIHKLFTSEIDQASEGENLLITSMRHKLAIDKAVFFLSQATSNIIWNASLELVAADLWDALNALEEITGKSVDDTILDKIFANFCIGK
ncbi:MAG: tRNA uridine-5-carboxymethylaminomethyl(34) synthesis GTPase MnmE [Syntrophales bacterium]|nr:tRNA uridine-5-carboxymethylaminomethyl(34) synthesis GTPase MnmE [Syntrophales bacterium]